MRQIISLILLSIYYSTSLGQTSFDTKANCDTFVYLMKSHDELLQYIDNPCPSDSPCKEDIIKAKDDIAKGQIKFLIPRGLGIFEARQEEQLRNLCNSNGLIFDYEVFGCLYTIGHTNGCYGLYMDKIIAQRFGKNFKENLIAKADSLFVASFPTVYYTNCDTIPRLFDKDIFQSTEMDVEISKELFSKLKVSNYGDYPQIDIGFNIDTTGIPSNYFLSQFITNGAYVKNKKIKRELTKLAFEYVKQFRLWKPGIILGQKVKTIYNVRVSFVETSK